jgi:hypothetical protein
LSRSSKKEDENDETRLTVSVPPDYWLMLEQIFRGEWSEPLAGRCHRQNSNHRPRPRVHEVRRATCRQTFVLAAAEIGERKIAFINIQFSSSSFSRERDCMQQRRRERFKMILMRVAQLMNF